MTTDKPKDSAWLQEQLVALLQDAMQATPIDHTACVKYADLLWKILPRTSESKRKSVSLQDLLTPET